MKRTSLLALAAALLTAGLASGAPAKGRSGFTAEEEKVCRELTLTARPWATVRWEVSLTEARQRAQREGKPIFLVVNTGNVLGFV